MFFFRGKVKIDNDDLKVVFVEKFFIKIELVARKVYTTSYNSWEIIVDIFDMQVQINIESFWQF